MILLYFLLIGLIFALGTKCCSVIDSIPTEYIKTLLRQTARWAVAAEQDENPMIAVLHANYAAGYLWALRDIATDAEILSASGVNILQLRYQITTVQDGATRKMAAVCPQYAQQTNQYLAQLAGEM